MGRNGKLLHLCFFLILLIQVRSQTVCRGFLFGTFDELIVNTTEIACGLVGTANRVTITNGGRFLVIGRSEITEIRADGADFFSIAGQTTVQDLYSTNTNQTVFIGSDSTVERVFVRDSGPFEHQGMIGTLDYRNSGTLNVTGGVIGDGSSNSMFINNGNPTVLLCGARIGQVTIKEASTRFLGQPSENCPQTNVSSLTWVGKGSSMVVKDLTLTGKHSFSAYNVDDVDISNTNFHGNVGMRQVSGAVSMRSVTADSLSLVGFQKSTSLVNSDFSSQVRIGAPDPGSANNNGAGFSTSISTCNFMRGAALGPSSGNVMIKGSNFSGSKLYVETRSGGATLIGNKNLSLRVQQVPQKVQVNENKILAGAFRSNRGGVELVDNKFETLLCVGNNPPPVLNGNIVTDGGSGQCASV